MVDGAPPVAVLVAGAGAAVVDYDDDSERSSAPRCSFRAVAVVSIAGAAFVVDQVEVMLLLQLTQSSH